MGTRALFSVPRQFIWFANGGGEEVVFVLQSVGVMVVVIYVKDCVVCVCIYICMHRFMKILLGLFFCGV